MSQAGAFEPTTPVNPRNESDYEVAYDTGKMGTPEHRAKVDADLDAIQKQFPHLTRSQALMLNIYRGTSKVSTVVIGTSGEMKRYRRACYRLRVPY